MAASDGCGDNVRWPWVWASRAFREARAYEHLQIGYKCARREYIDAIGTIGMRHAECAKDVCNLLDKERLYMYAAKCRVARHDSVYDWEIPGCSQGTWERPGWVGGGLLPELPLLPRVKGSFQDSVREVSLALIDAKAMGDTASAARIEAIVEGLKAAGTRYEEVKVRDAGLILLRRGIIVTQGGAQ